MKYLVFAPGILGSVLKRADRTVVWPPTVFEAIFGYGRIDELMADDVQATDIIRNVSVRSIYATLIDDIRACGYTEGGAERRYLPFPYDWRRSNKISADALASRLDVSHQDTAATSITLLGHSMGGLVLRYLLESGHYNDRSWFSRIDRLITLGTPHFGAPVALFRLTGQESSGGLSGEDVRRLASDTRYPSLYELAPPTASALTVEQANRGEVPRPIETFDRRIVDSLGLNSQNINAASSFWQELDLARRPASDEHTVDYFLFAASRHQTIVRNELRSNGSLEQVRRKDSGDGTVPFVSAAVTGEAHAYSDKEHGKIFTDRTVREMLYRFLDAPADIRPQAAGTEANAVEGDSFGMSLDKFIYEPGEPIEVSLSYAKGITDPAVSFEIIEIDPDSEEDKPDGNRDSVAIRLRGVNLEVFSFNVSNNLGPGLYEMRPLGVVDDPEKTYFVVSQADQ